METGETRVGDTVLVHSAMSRIGHGAEGAPAVVDAFLDVLGPAGPLAVPTFPAGRIVRLAKTPFGARVTGVAG